ncbi:hypothetical protein [Azospirillum agricola]|uniref:hypothetical protein n=1 Tax=Azospirillum agricola TaxID=1720247 RepID=UPI000A0EF337|nr:hypothetical protein [Azospirillum agricola]SMH30351.1 hypothetical protein SAMN02982994_0290 [Azospirillum lipoferum]
MSNDDGLGDALLARVAACNFDATIFDTNDLSTIRGSGLIVLRFPDRIVQRLNRDRPDLRVSAIASGASELLFRFAPLPGASDAVEELLRAMLEDRAGQVGWPWTLFTYVWAVERPDDRAGSDFVKRRHRLVARCNAQQYQRRTITLPPFHSDAQRVGRGEKVDTASVVCAFDGLRPATPGLRQKDRPVSASVRWRRGFGVKAKGLFYEEELKSNGCRPALPFAWEFSDLAPTPEERKTHDIPESLAGKMALIYLDGNGFGRRREEEGRTAAGLTGFSERVKAKRRDMLHAVLTSLEKRPGMIHPGDDLAPRRLRFETLLWGGDEVMWALPAWHAWAVMGEVQAHLNGGQWGELSHAAGMLIAPYKAPIKHLAALVKDLAEVGKDVDRGINGVQIGIVAGFDMPGVTVDALRRPLFDLVGTVGDVPHGAFHCDGARWPEIQKAMEAIKHPQTGLPRSSLYRSHHEALAKGLFAIGKAEEARRHLNAGIGQIELVHEGAVDPQALDILRTGFPGAQGVADHPLVPLHQILSLWDLAR